MHVAFFVSHLLSRMQTNYVHTSTYHQLVYVTKYVQPQKRFMNVKAEEQQEGRGQSNIPNVKIHLAGTTKSLNESLCINFRSDYLELIIYCHSNGFSFSKSRYLYMTGMLVNCLLAYLFILYDILNKNI